MKDQKRNERIELSLSVKHPESTALASSMVTEVDCTDISGEISIELQSASFSDIRARWNSMMRALIASEHSLEATSGGDEH